MIVRYNIINNNMLSFHILPLTSATGASTLVQQLLPARLQAVTNTTLDKGSKLAIAGRLCPIRDINKNGRRNRREDSTPKFFIRSFINGNANSFYLTLQIRSLLRNDSFRLHRQTRPEIYHFPRHTKNTLVKKPVMKTVHFELRLGFKWLPRPISKFSPCILL